MYCTLQIVDRVKWLERLEITENPVLGLICTQKGQQITKLDFFGFFSKYFGKIA
jgi:hypothetical protein